MIEQLGVYVVAPLMSTITAGAVFFSGRYILKTSKVLSDVEARVANNEDEIDYVKERIDQIHS